MTREEIMVEILKLPHNDKVQLSDELRTLAQLSATRTLHPGARVFFMTKHGVRVDGVVTRVNAKSVKVTADSPNPGMNWTVSPQLLQVVSK